MPISSPLLVNVASDVSISNRISYLVNRVGANSTTVQFSKDSLTVWISGAHHYRRSCTAIKVEMENDQVSILVNRFHRTGLIYRIGCPCWSLRPPQVLGHQFVLNYRSFLFGYSWHYPRPIDYLQRPCLGPNQHRRCRCQWRCPEHHHHLRPVWTGAVTRRGRWFHEQAGDKGWTWVAQTTFWKLSLIFCYQCSGMCGHTKNNLFCWVRELCNLGLHIQSPFYSFNAYSMWGVLLAWPR